jgi:hypothetical protein
MKEVLAVFSRGHKIRLTLPKILEYAKVDLDVRGVSQVNPRTGKVVIAPYNRMAGDVDSCCNPSTPHPEPELWFPRGDDSNAHAPCQQGIPRNDENSHVR